MRKIFISTIVFLLISQTICGQKSVKRTYKTFADTSFKVGDIILAPEIIFSVSSCEILPEAKDSVDIIANFIKKHPTFKIEIGVHTDVRGVAKSNITLSECRANSILGYLTKELLLPADNFAIKGYGSSEPRVSKDEISKSRNPHEDLHKINRRVEIKILKT